MSPSPPPQFPLDSIPPRPGPERQEVEGPDENGWIAACPRCRKTLGRLGLLGESVECQECGGAYGCRQGIWHFLPPEREAYFAPFLRDYTLVRHAEGRGSANPTYYHHLPEVEPSDPMAWQWRIRARTFACLQRRVLPRLGPGRWVLDLGAGTGWLSHRLASLGHRPGAVDLTVDDRDGLGAASHYAPHWPLFQAEFDRLPLAGAQADVVVYNASLHYSTDYRVTLAEALRVLRPGGHIVVMDSPIYRRPESGQQMRAERHADFERRYGTRSDSLPSLEYLTWDLLDDLALGLRLRWRIFTPWYGWGWALRPWRAGLQGKREPSKFAILVGQQLTEARR